MVAGAGGSGTFWARSLRDVASMIAGASRGLLFLIEAPDDARGREGLRGPAPTAATPRSPRSFACKMKPARTRVGCGEPLFGANEFSPSNMESGPMSDIIDRT